MRLKVCSATPSQRHERKRSQASLKEKVASVMKEKVTSVMKEKIPANCIVAVSISIHNPPHEGT